MAEFKEEYFEGEYREGFYVESMMKRAWAAQIEVLEVLDQICRKHNIQYFADWGTLLGAVRHKGFIPWDDDIDIAMKREDYQRFLSAFSKEKPEKYCLLSIHTEETWRYPFSRITNGNTICYEEKHLQRYHGCPYAVGIDIFPLDYIPKTDEAEVQVELLSAILTLLGIDQSYKIEFDKEQGEEALLKIEELCGVTIDRNGNVENQLLKLMDRISALYGPQESEELTLMVERCNKRGLKFPKEWYEESLLFPFENVTIPVPKGYDGILKTMYGDYMTPVKNIQVHEYPFYKKQDKYYTEIEK